MGRPDAGADGRPQVLRPARHVAARDPADHRLRRVGVRRGARLRRLLDPGLAGNRGVGHAADAGRGERRPRSLHRGADPLADLRDRRPAHARGLRQGPEADRPAGGGVPERDGHRRHGLHRPGMRVLRPRLGLLRARRSPLALRDRLGRGPLELGRAGAWLHGAAQGGLLPARTARHPARPAQRDGAHPRAARHPVRVPPPRGGLGRAVRDRPALPAADADGRPGDDLQVRGQERRPRRGQDGHLHAEAALRRQRLGHAHPPVPLEGGHAVDGGQIGLRRALAARALVRRRVAGPRAGAARLLRADHELVSPPRPGLRGARQPRLLAAEPLGVHPDPDVLRRAEGRSGSSSAAPTRPRTRTSPFRRC